MRGAPGSETTPGYPAGHSQKELLRILTAGSVDDGKSTLIGRLLYDTQLIFDDQLAALKRDSVRTGTTGGEIDLSLLMDGLKAEREQGITIDVAYRYFTTARRKFIIADCPGHEQYTRNMATGASNCDLAIILVDARNGVMRQTKRHSFIVSLLGIKHVVVAINKMDLVGYSEAVFDDIRQAFTDFSTRLEMTDVRFIPLSALAGDNVVAPSVHMGWYGGETLLHYLESVHIASDRNLIDFRFPVQLVSRPTQDFRGYAGTIASGVVRSGDEIVVLPSGRRTHVKAIVSAEGELDEAFSPQAITLTLADEVDVSRGDMLVHPANMPRIQQQFEAMVVWMGEDALTPGKLYWIKHATSSVSGQIESVRYRVDVNTLHREATSRLEMNEVGRCQVLVNRPLCIDPYRHNRTTGAFILIDRATNVTVGAGMIVDRATSMKSLDDHWTDDTPDASATTVPTQVTPAERESRFKQRAVTVLLTGRSGSGKTTLAYALERRLFDAGQTVVVLDGRRMRETISRDLGFSAAERSENLRRSIDVARIVNEAGLICVCAFMAPSEEVRYKAKAALGADRFLEVYVAPPVEVSHGRERQRFYAQADSTLIADSPEIPVSYDTPKAPDLILDTADLTVEQCVDRLIEALASKGAVDHG